MLTLFGPILAQLVTVGAGLRTEGRAVVIDTTHHYEAATRPVVSLDVASDRFRFDLVYTPSFTLTPLESDPKLLVFNLAGVSATYSWRRTTLSVGEFVGYGEQNFQVLATAGAVAVPGVGVTTGPTVGTGAPGAGTGATPSGTGNTGSGAAGTGAGATGTGAGVPPVAGTTGPTRISDLNVLYASSTTTAGVSHLISPQVTLGATAAYIVAGAVKSQSRADYPLVKGPAASVIIQDRFDRENSAAASFNVQNTVSSNGNEAWLWGTIESWNHAFSIKTSTQLGAGVSAGRVSRSDGYVAYSVYPTFIANFIDVERLSPGSLTVNFGVGSTPALDPTTLALDPRITILAGIAWQRERLTMTFGSSAAISVAGNRQNALSSVGGAAGVSYRIADPVSADCGVRAAYQVYHGNAVLPLSYAGFVGLTLALSKPLR